MNQREWFFHGQHELEYKYFLFFLSQIEAPVFSLAMKDLFMLVKALSSFLFLLNSNLLSQVFFTARLFENFPFIFLLLYLFNLN
jgi:hypothetical protein